MVSTLLLISGSDTPSDVTVSAVDRAGKPSLLGIDVFRSEQEDVWVGVGKVAPTSSKRGSRVSAAAA